MAKNVLSLSIRAIQAAERSRARQARVTNRRDVAEQREILREAKAYEANVRKTTIQDERDKRAHEKALKAAHEASQQAEVDSRNLDIESKFEELEGLLRATIDVDDYIDLEALRETEETRPFDRPELEVPAARSMPPIFPPMPKFVEPEKPKGFFGKKRKIEEAQEKATQAHKVLMAQWRREVAALETKHEHDMTEYETAEVNRIEALAKEKIRFQEELQQHNYFIDKFISDLSYGDAAAVQEYISLVVNNSIYPDHFEVSHDFIFQPEAAELRMTVRIPSPNDFPSIKAYKYIKASDEIRETSLSKTELKTRYCDVLHQVAIRSLHEVFEADRRGLIKTIALEVGTEGSDPATGRTTFLPFVGVSAERESFLEFDLSGLIPLSTLKYLGAALSKDPVNLVAVDTTGVRKS